VTFHAVGLAHAGLAIQALASAATSSSTLNDVEPGLLGFLVVAGLGVALVFLLRSMNKQLRKIGPAPEDETEEASAATAEAASDAGQAHHSADETAHRSV
jgi:hypothetical protein